MMMVDLMMETPMNPDGTTSAGPSRRGQGRRGCRQVGLLFTERNGGRRGLSRDSDDEQAREAQKQLAVGARRIGRSDARAAGGEECSALAIIERVEERLQARPVAYPFDR
jgi:hypothetical protein